jgi:hypothetical protein
MERANGLRSRSMAPGRAWILFACTLPHLYLRYTVPRTVQGWRRQAQVKMPQNPQRPAARSDERSEYGVHALLARA